MADKTNEQKGIKFSSAQGQEVDVHFQDLVEWITEGVYCVNAEGILVYANESFCKILGYTTEELTGKEIFDLIYNEANRNLSKAKLQLRKKGISDSYELQMKNKAGEAVWVKMSGRPIMATDGDFLGSVVICTDTTQQRKLEEELILAKEDLESKVITRTRQLSEANQKLYEQVKERRLAEISLKNSEKRFRDIYVNSPDAIYVESYEGVILDVNEATCKLHHHTAENLIGKSIYDVSPAEIHATIRERQPKIVSGEITKFESECITEEGLVIPIEISAAHIDFKEQKALLMHVRDISDRKHNEKLLKNINAELELKVNERTRELMQVNERIQKEMLERERFQGELKRQKDFLRLIIDSTPNLIFVKDKDGKFLLANESVAKFYNMTAQELEGHFDTEHNFTKEELAEFKQQDEEVIRLNSEVKFPEKSYYNKETKSTTWLQTVKKIIPSLVDNDINILGVSTDVTAIREAREEIKLSEQLYREIAHHLPNAAIFIFDRDMRFLLADGPLVGVISKPKSEIEGKTVSETIRPTELARVEKLYREILDGHSSEEEQVFFGRQMKVHHTPIRNDKGEVVYGMVMVFDISALKNVQIELENRATLLQSSNEELERFAYVASHDLQGPLRTIASYLQLLETRYKGKLDSEALEFIDFSVAGARRMQALILDLLNYSRISSTPKPFVSTNMNEVVANVTASLKSTITSSLATVHVGPLPVILADASQMFQLFQNLIDNGIKFIKDKKPEITIACLEREKEWEFSVADNGIGIREDFKDKIYQIFQRLHSESEYSGTGVGLAICKKIVELHGGRIWFENAEKGGTIFRFTIRKMEKQS